MTDSLPKFRVPPVVETVLGLQFEPIRGLSNAHLGAFWKSMGDQWPIARDAPPLRIVSTLLRPTRGTAEVAGLDSVRDAGRIRPLVGLLGHNTALYDHLTASENLVFSVRMAGVREDPAAITDALQRVRLIGSSTERVRGFSAGMRRRLGLARLLLRPPTVLLLDEPYASFDEDGIDLVNGFATDVASRGGLVLLATHDLTRAEDIMTRRIHIENGRLIELRDTAPLHAGVAL